MYLPQNEARLKRSVQEPSGLPPIGDVYVEPRNIALRKTVLGAMEAEGVDMLIYPTWSNPPRMLSPERQVVRAMPLAQAAPTPPEGVEGS